MGYYAIRNWEGSFSRLTSLLCLGLAFMVHTTVMGQQAIYYSASDGGAGVIGRLDSPSGNKTILLAGVTGPDNIVLDTEAGKAYWSSLRKIERSDLNGDNREVVILTEPHTPSDIALDAANSKIYWIEGNNPGQIRRTDLEGNNIESLIDIDLVRPKSIAIDLIHSKLYWVNADTNRIERADLNGDNRETFLDELDEPNNLAIDPGENRIYWTGSATIERADLFGGNRETVVPDVVFPSAFALDAANAKIYWSGGFEDTIERADPDGGNREMVMIRGILSISDIAVDEINNGVYWTTLWTIERTDLDNPSRHIIIGWRNPGPITLDPIKDKIYWMTTIPHNQRVIQRANLDGTNRETLIFGWTPPGNPSALNWDVTNQKIYWADKITEKIERANFDGSDREVVGTVDVSDVKRIVVDPVQSKIYWRKSTSGLIHFMDFDGSNRSVLPVDGSPDIILPDGINKRIYWINDNIKGIQRIDLDSTNSTTLIRDLDGLEDIALDPVNHKIYWASRSKGTIEKMHLNGTNREVLTTDAGKIEGIALGPFPDPLPIGDVSGDGVVDVQDAALILQYAVGLIDSFPVETLVSQSPKQTAPRHYEISIPEIRFRVGERAFVPIRANDASGLWAGGLTLKYDATLLRAVRVMPTMPQSYWEGNTSLSGEVRFAFININPPKAGNELMLVEFEALPHTQGQTSTLVLTDIQLAGSASIQKTESLITILPDEFRLYQNFPNPFNPETWIPYDLAVDSDAEIMIYDVSGHRVRTLALGTQAAGSYRTRAKRYQRVGRQWRLFLPTSSWRLPRREEADHSQVRRTQ